MTRTRTIHYCNVCDYKTNRKYDKDKHLTRMHGSNVQQNVNQAYSNIQNKHNYHDETEQNENNNEDYNKVVGIAQGWKNECEVKDNAIRVRDVHLQNQNIKLQQEYAKNQNIVDKNKQLNLEKSAVG